MDMLIDDFRARLTGYRPVTVYADPPWQHRNRFARGAPENAQQSHYETLPTEVIASLPVAECTAPDSHLYLWVPNAMLADGLEVMAAWGYEYKTSLVWEKVRKDGQPDGGCMGWYFRNVTELCLFGSRTSNSRLAFRTLAPARSLTNLIRARRRQHSRKPQEFYHLIEQASPGPYLEMFARGVDRDGWIAWGNEAEEYKNTLRTPAYMKGIGPEI